MKLSPLDLKFILSLLEHLEHRAKSLGTREIPYGEENPNQNTLAIEEVSNLINSLKSILNALEKAPGRPRLHLINLSTIEGITEVNKQMRAILKEPGPTGITMDMQRAEQSIHNPGPNMGRIEMPHIIREKRGIIQAEDLIIRHEEAKKDIKARYDNRRFI